MAAGLSRREQGQPTSGSIRIRGLRGTQTLAGVLSHVMDGVRVSEKNTAVPATRANSGTSIRLAKRLGLRLTSVEDLTITRRANGRGFVYSYPNGKQVRDRTLIGRLNRLAVPPAYADALYCPDPQGHLQAIWRDAAGRLQYCYHPDWDEVRS